MIPVVNAVATISEQFTANGTSNSFTISGGYTPSQVAVFVNGVKQLPITDVDITSGTTINLTSTPLNGYAVDVFGYNTVIPGVLTTANTALFLSNSSGTLVNIQNYITGNAATAYTNAIAYSANADNISSGTVSTARLGSGTANSTTVLYGNGVFAAAPDSTNASALISGTVAPARLGSGTANSTTVLYGNGVFALAPDSTNAAALISGTIGTARLGSGVANSTTILYGNSVFAPAPDSTNAAALTTGTIGTARLGSGTANSTTILYGNSVFAPAPDSTNASSLTTGTVNASLLASGTANSTTILYGNSVWAAAPSSTNASALTTGTVNTSLLGSGTANSTTILYGNGVFAPAPDGVNTAFQYTFTNAISFGSNVSITLGLLNGTVGATAPNTGAFTTLSTSGIITASAVGNIIPFYYNNQAGFPSAMTYHGAIAHSHSDGAMYFAHASAWTRLLDTGGGYTVTGTANYSGNVVLTSGNGTNQLLLGTINATSIGMLANSTTLTTGNSTVNTTISAANTALFTPTIRGSRETVLANTNAAGAMILDLSYGIFRWTVTGNVTSLNFTNVPANNTVYTGMLYVTANATGTNSTNRAITFPSVANATTGKTLWPGATVPPATSSNSSLDIYSFTTIDGGNNYIWSLSVKDAR